MQNQCQCQQMSSHSLVKKSDRCDSDCLKIKNYKYENCNFSVNPAFKKSMFHNQIEIIHFRIREKKIEENFLFIF
jgi:hypothetical protein